MPKRTVFRVTAPIYLNFISACSKQQRKAMKRMLSPDTYFALF
jgi:hypothetical protein